MFIIVYIFRWLCAFIIKYVILEGEDVYRAVVWGAAMCYALGFGIVFVSGRLVKVTEHLLV